MIQTVKRLIELRYEKDYAWRRAWNALAHGTVLRTSNQQEYIEHRAQLANLRIAELMHVWDLHKPDKR